MNEGVRIRMSLDTPALCELELRCLDGGGKDAYLTSMMADLSCFGFLKFFLMEPSY
jgi:hypothetical protein